MIRSFPGVAPGSNAIGRFQIGVSPIGTAGFRWQDTVISQYANSPRLIEIIADFCEAEDQAEDFDNFYDLVWNVNTAQGAGLDLWGRIVGVRRTLVVSQSEYLGFEEAADTLTSPFNQAPYYSGQTVTSNYDLSDSAYRFLIMAKAAFNICEGSIPAINRVLMLLFPGRGNAFVEDGISIDDQFFGFSEAGHEIANPFNQQPFYSGEPFVPMSIKYVFDFALSPVEIAIVTQSGALPTPVGVTAVVVINA